MSRRARSWSRRADRQEFFIIVSGTAAVTRNGKKVAALGPNAHFGELALLDRRPRSASVVSETEMDLLVLSQRQFNGLLESVPTIARKMLSAMANRLRDADAAACRLQTDPAVTATVRGPVRHPSG